MDDERYIGHILFDNYYFLLEEQGSQEFQNNVNAFDFLKKQGKVKSFNFEVPPIFVRISQIEFVAWEAFQSIISAYKYPIFWRKLKTHTVNNVFLEEQMLEQNCTNEFNPLHKFLLDWYRTRVPNNLILWMQVPIEKALNLSPIGHLNYTLKDKLQYVG